MTTRQASLRPGSRLGTGISYAALIAITALVSIPFVWVLISSLKRMDEFFAYPVVLWPAEPQWANYVQAVTIFPYFSYALRTFFLAAGFAVLTMLSSALAGFAFARIRVRGAGLWFRVVVALLIVPSIVTVIPQFILFSRLGLTNTYWPWVIWGLTASPFHIFMFRQFFAGFPHELEDAAEVDGCSAFRTFWQIFLPNAQPVVATSLIFSFTSVWSDWFTPFIYLSNTLTTLGVRMTTGYIDQTGHTIWPVAIAGNVLYTIPLIVIFFVSQRFIVQGVVTTGLKG